MTKLITLPFVYMPTIDMYVWKISTEDLCREKKRKIKMSFAKALPSKSLVIRINLVFLAVFFVIYALLLLRPSSSYYHESAVSFVRCSLRQCHHKVRWATSSTNSSTFRKFVLWVTFRMNLVDVLFSGYIAYFVQRFSDFSFSCLPNWLKLWFFFFWIGGEWD